MTDESYQKLIELANGHIEGRLDESSREELETLLRDDPEQRRAFADFLHDHAALHWEYISESDNVIPLPPVSRQSPNILTWSALTAAVLAISALLGVLFLGQPDPGSGAFVTMEKTRAARWESANLPTVEGARLSAGTLRLAEGLATLRFDSGAEVVLEAPAVVELINGMNCRLVSGTAVADIPDSALGFQISTPAAKVVDYGTRFAVNVDSLTGATQTQVFEGLVEVEHPESGEIVTLKTGETNFVAGDSIGQATAAPDETEWVHSTQPLQRGPEWTKIPSSRDAYVYSVDVAHHHSEILLLLKNSSDTRGPHRKAYLGFDLSTLDPSQIVEAELKLNFAPTGWGLASHLLDSEFSVYGLTGPHSDQWQESTIAWNSAPANEFSTGDTLKKEGAVLLGKFSVEQGFQRGEFGIDDSRLSEFLQKQKGKFASLVVIRNTKETEGGGLVHGIASHRHPTLPAPTLVIRSRE